MIYFSIWKINSLIEKTQNESNDVFFAIWKINTVYEIFNKEDDKQTLERHSSATGQSGLHLVASPPDHWVHTETPDHWMFDREGRKNRRHMFLKSINENSASLPFRSIWSRKTGSEKVAKTKKSPTTRANQQQHLDKNDFSAWKVPLSPLAFLWL